MGEGVRIRHLDRLGEREIEGLSNVLTDCVEGGASVSFMLPMTSAKAEAFWRGVAEGVARGDRVVLAAEDARGGIVGTVQVIWAQPENQPHRGDVAKMLVHRRARRRGVGAALLAAAERAALDAGKTLLVLDTVTGADAERMYARSGWQRCGVIPSYALWPDGRPCATTVFFKALSAPSSRHPPSAKSSDKTAEGVDALEPGQFPHGLGTAPCGIALHPLAAGPHHQAELDLARLAGEILVDRLLPFERLQELPGVHGPELRTHAGCHVARGELLGELDRLEASGARLNARKGVELLLGRRLRQRGACRPQGCGQRQDTHLVQLPPVHSWSPASGSWSCLGRSGQR
jgi:GNAT superfamily N-acetyltransferase